MKHLKTALQNNFRLETKLLSDSSILPVKSNLLINNFPAYTLPLPKYKIRLKRKSRKEDCPPCPEPRVTRNKNAMSHFTDIDSSEVFSGIELDKSDFIDDNGKNAVIRKKTKTKADTKFSTKEKFDTIEFAKGIVLNLIVHNRKIDNKEVKHLFVTTFNLKPDSYIKEIQESYELALVQHAREIVFRRKGNAEYSFNAILEAYNNQPVLNVRTSDSVSRQAYSTPIPLGYLISNYLELKEPGNSVFEPCAGNGSLLIAARENNVIANELDPTRLKHLEALGFKTVSGNALDYIPSKKFKRIVMNPPFGFYQPKIKFKGETINNIDQAIAIHSLQFLETKGLAAIILGGHNLKKDKHGGFKANDRFFLDYIYKNFDVILNLDINGDLYRKQGTSFDIRLIILQNTVTNNYSHVIPYEYGMKPGQVTKINSWDELYNILNNKNATSHEEITSEQRTREHSDKESESLEKSERETRELNLSNERAARKSGTTRSGTSIKQKDGSRGHSRGNSKEDSGSREEKNQGQDGNDSRHGLPGKLSSDSVRDSVVEFDENKANVMMEFFKKFGM